MNRALHDGRSVMMGFVTSRERLPLLIGLSVLAIAMGVAMVFA